MDLIKPILIKLASISILCGLLLSGCTSSRSTVTPSEDTLYLTPIPQSTVVVYIPTPPVATKLQAVMLARLDLLRTRLEFSNPPDVLLVEEMELTKALQLIGESTANNTLEKPGDTKVWLVIFTGDVRIVPPDASHSATLPAPGHGCASVIIYAGDAELGQVSGTACPQLP